MPKEKDFGAVGVASVDVEEVAGFEGFTPAVSAVGCLARGKVGEALALDFGGKGGE